MAWKWYLFLWREIKVLQLSLQKDCVFVFWKELTMIQHILLWVFLVKFIQQGKFDWRNLNAFIIGPLGHRITLHISPDMRVYRKFLDDKYREMDQELWWDAERIVAFALICPILKIVYTWMWIWYQIDPTSKELAKHHDSLESLI